MTFTGSTGVEHSIAATVCRMINGITIDLAAASGSVEQSRYGRKVGPEALDAFHNTHVTSSTANPS